MGHSSSLWFGRAPTTDGRATEAYVPQIRGRYLTPSPGVAEEAGLQKRRFQACAIQTREEPEVAYNTADESRTPTESHPPAVVQSLPWVKARQ